MSHSQLDQLSRAEELFNQGNLEEALEILNDESHFEGLNLQQKSHFQFLKGLILFYYNKCEDLIDLGEKIYEEGQKRNDNLQSFDGLWFIITGLALFGKYDESFGLFKKIEILITNISNVSKDVLTLRKLRLSTIKAYVSLRTGNADLTEECLGWILNSQEAFEKTFEIVFAHAIMAQNLATLRCNFDLCMEYTKKALTLATEIKFNHFWIALCHILLGASYQMVGELDNSLKYYMKSLKLIKKIECTYYVALVLNNIGNVYGDKGDYDLAVQYLEESLTLHEQIPPGEFQIDGVIDSMITLAIEHGDIDRVKKYFHRLEEIYKQKKDKNSYRRLKSKLFDLEILFNFNKALMLKNSSRIRDKAKAQELLKKIIDTTFFEVNIKAHIHLCDLLLFEYHIENNIEVLNELNYYISSLLDIAEKQHSYLVFCKTFLLQAKLALLNFDVKAARRFLTQAQMIAEKYGIKRLAMKISHEHDELLRQINLWENLKDSGASLTERWELSGVNDQMKNIVKKQMTKVPELSEEEPVFLLIVSEGGRPLYSHSFIEEIAFESHLFGGFLTTIDYFIREVFSEGLDRAMFGEYTLLMKSIPPFFISYIFRGDSYYAHQKIIYFMEHIQKEENLWQELLNSFQVHQTIHLKDSPLLDSLITEIFINKSIIFREV